MSYYLDVMIVYQRDLHITIKLFNFLNDRTPTFLKICYHVSPYGMIMCERIGMIRYYMDGQLINQHYLSELLAKCRPDEPGVSFEDREESVALF